jgi:hypothetical protein
MAKYTINWPGEWPSQPSLTLLSCLGYISIVVVHPEEMASSAKRALNGELRTLSRSSYFHQRLYLHTFGHPEHIAAPFNSLINLARFYAPTELTLLVPVLPLLPIISQYLGSADSVMEDIGYKSVIFLGQGIAPPHNGEFEVSSALLLRKSSGPWCPDRFVSMRETQWRQCLWRVWLLSLGQFHFVSIGSSFDATEPHKGTSTLAQDHILVCLIS